jgi:hypothetical protein
VDLYTIDDVYSSTGMYLATLIIVVIWCYYIRNRG